MPAAERRMRIEKHLVRYMELCPEQPFGALVYSGSFHDPAFWKEHLGPIARSIRSALRAHVTALPNLWSLEFQLAAPTEYGEVRRRIAGDVADLEATGPGDRHVLEILDKGYRLAGEPTKAAAIAAKLRASSPCSREAVQAIVSDWTKDHPEAISGSGGAGDRDATSVGAARRAFERAAKLYGDYRGYSNPSGYEQVAAIFLERRVSLDRVLPLLDQAAQEVRGFRSDQDLSELPGEERTEIEREYAERDWRIDLLVARAHLARGELGTARRLLHDLGSRLESSETPSAGKPAQSDEVFARELDRSTLWAARGELAEAEGHDRDAVGLYLRAEAARPKGGARWLVDSEAGESEARAEALWRKLGGTAKGLSALRAAAVAVPGTTASNSGWSESAGSLPACELSDVAGHTWKRSDLRGKTVFLSAWATWSGPCREKLQVHGIPQSWIVDPRGALRFQKAGYDAGISKEEWLARAEARIDEAAGGGGASRSRPAQKSPASSPESSAASSSLSATASSGPTGR